MSQLENLVKINKIHPEPPDQEEINGMISAAARSLSDVDVQGLSQESRFTLAYGAAHALSRAALRWHGYRTDSRYIVFQCLPHTVGLATEKWKVLDLCHQRRNLAEYEGHLEVEPKLLDELIEISNELLETVQNLGPIQS